MSAFAYDALEEIRKRLLDLTAKNTLLNYRHTKGRSLRIVADSIDRIYTALQSGKPQWLQPVPEPTRQQLLHFSDTPDKNEASLPKAEEWAKELGIDTNPELAVSSTADNHQAFLQTLYYDAPLAGLLSKIRAQANSAFDETGANILYLILGFLEWEDSKSARHLAPLFTLPVKLERDKSPANGGVRRYSLSLQDDDTFSNVTLQEKLWQDFDLQLPSIDEEQTPEAYFSAVEQILQRGKPEWKVRRQATLALLNFTKQAMYQDLDPNNWPTDLSIEQHPIIRNLFSRAEETADANKSVQYATEYNIDHIEHIHDQFPLIYDADSSQHSALIDAVNGKNLVIEGPPGTGKSQTITNLIAACLNSGKTVLFVAEKMAALNVVKDRLDQAGLGDFCLELHSHKTNKKALLHELVTKWEKQGSYRRAAQIHTDIQYYEKYKTQLLHYAELINQPWQGSGLSMHDILNRATRRRLELTVSPDDITLSLDNTRQLDVLTRATLLDQGKIMAEVFQEASAQSPTGILTGHYWYGVQKASFTADEERALTDALQAWNNALATLVEIYRSWQQDFAQDLAAMDNNEMQHLLATVRQLPVLQGNEDFSINPVKLVQAQTDLSAFLQQYEQHHQQWEKLQHILPLDDIHRSEDIQPLVDTLTYLHSLCSDTGRTMREFVEGGKQAWSAQYAINELEKELARIRPQVPEDIRYLFTAHMESGRDLAIFVDMIEQLPGNLWQYRSPVFNNSDLGVILEQLHALFKEIAPLHRRIAIIFNIEQLPDADTLQNYQDILEDNSLLRFVSPQWRATKKTLSALLRRAKSNWQEVMDTLPDAIHYRQRLHEIERLIRSQPGLIALYQGVDTPIDQWMTLYNWYKNVRHTYSTGFNSKAAVGTTLFTLERRLADDIRSIYHSQLRERFITIDRMLRETRRIFDQWPIPTAGQNTIDLNPLIDALKGHLPVLKRFRVSGEISLRILMQAIEQLQRRPAEAQRLEAEKQQLPLPSLWRFSPDYGQFDSAEVAAARNTLAVCLAVQAHPVVAAALSPETFSAARYTHLQTLAARLTQNLADNTQAEQRFLTLGAVDKTAWLGDAADSVAIQTRNAKALSQPRWLGTWAQYRAIRTRLSSDGLERLVACLENGILTATQLLPAIELAMYQRLAQEILTNHPEIQAFSGMSHNAAIQRFRECDKQLLTLQQAQIAFHAAQKDIPQGVATGKVSGYSEIALIRHEYQKKTKHISIRNLLDRAPKSIAALKPCFMMSPLSVAQYLKPGHFQFDIVIMDEASQILPEDAIGAIARSARTNASAVIVGDPKQLPPTNFFQAALDGDGDGDGGVALQEMESILDAVIPDATFSTRRLTWHYRSRHESLIAFSNKHFYDEKLILFPSPMAESADLGIRYKRVDGSCVDGRNKVEAEIIAQEAARILQQHPDESLGIVAMNSKQQEEIAIRFEQMLKDNPLLQKICDEKEKIAPVFIKNLENVQGDERDVILISMTYGPDKIGGRVYQRFGPINRDEGWRRLNVLFTRAKKRMHIISSMDATDIVVGSESKKGVVSLRAFLEYCEKGHLYQAAITDRAPDSDFEIAVMETLAQYGYQCIPQVGVNGFFLDIAVKNPHRPGHFLMGIECDGATYHSAKSVRDRDRLRQEILENLGWEIHRIWSTDWFKNPEAVLWPILQRLETLSTQYARETGEDAAEIAATMQYIAVQEKPEHIDNATSTLPTTSIKMSLTTQHAVAADEAEQNEADWDESGHVDVDISDTSLATSSAPPLAVQLQQLAEELAHLHPDVPDNERLLRPEIIKLLLTEVPASREEFQNIIPRRMRENISVKEAPYLDRVLKIIETAP